MRIAVFQVPYVGAVEAIRWQREQFDLIALPEYCNATAIDNPAELPPLPKRKACRVARNSRHVRCACPK